MKKKKSQCPCGHGRSYTTCCKPYHTKVTYPETAEQLMRSRYCAYAQGVLNYLMETHHPAHFDPSNISSIQKTFAECKWTDLKILDKDKGGKNDETGTVHFLAEYEEDGKKYTMEENSFFVKLSGKWVYQCAI